MRLEKGEIFGELGLVSPDHCRTQTIVCEEAGTLLVITYDKVRQLYFQNPKFGFFFLQLVTERLRRDAMGPVRRQEAPGGARP